MKAAPSPLARSPHPPILEAAQAARPGTQAGLAEAEAEAPEALDESKAQEQVVDSKAGGLATSWEPLWGREAPSDGAQSAARAQSGVGEPGRQGG